MLDPSGLDSAPNKTILTATERCLIIDIVSKLNIQTLTSYLQDSKC